jgi:hypothetical protein
MAAINSNMTTMVTPLESKPAVIGIAKKSKMAATILANIRLRYFRRCSDRSPNVREHRFRAKKYTRMSNGPLISINSETIGEHHVSDLVTISVAETG